MRKALSGANNLNEIPRLKLQNPRFYRGQSRIMSVRSEPRYAGAGMFLDQPVNFAYGESRVPTMRRQARPYGVF